MNNLQIMMKNIDEKFLNEYEIEFIDSIKSKTKKELRKLTKRQYHFLSSLSSKCFDLKKRSKSEIMKRAWQIAREGQKKFGGKVREYISESMKMAWAEAKG